MKTTNSDLTFDVGEADFAEKVLERSRTCPVLVDFWAEWCAPCLVLGPVLERVVQAYDGLFLLAKVEVDDNMRLAGHYKLRGFPTVILFRNGEPVARFSGAQPEYAVREFIETHIVARR
ncbi:MAG: thioredoxin domain-containing protein [Gammaproteobacteria bacterium]